MQSVINHLIQVQELVLTREETEVTHSDEQFAPLDEAIRAMTEDLPREIRAHLERLRKRDHLVITPVAGSGCAACGLKLPVGLLQAVRAAKAVHNCPNCARILYYPDAAPRHVRKARPRSQPIKPGISRFSAPGLMIPRLASADKRGVIRELAAKMEVEGFVDRSDTLAEMALRREAMLGTAVGDGLAFPHVRGIEGGGLAIALGISRVGVDFGAPGNGLARIIFFVAIPTAASVFYLELLAGLVKAFTDAEARDALMRAEEAEGLWRALIASTDGTIK